MKVAISYFAQLRNFKPNMIPVSTAAFDPKWYHDYKGPKQVFYDKKGVINGARCELLVRGKNILHFGACIASAERAFIRIVIIRHNNTP